MHWQIHKDGRADLLAAPDGRIPVAVALGLDPVTAYSASAPAAEAHRRADGRRLPQGLRRSQLVQVQDGRPRGAGERRDRARGLGRPRTTSGIEGPFGDHTGFYTPPEEFPIFRISAITMRRDAIYPSIVVGKPPAEDEWLAKATERIFLPAIRMSVPEIVDYDLPTAGAFHNCVIVSIRKRFPGHARKVMHAMWGLGPDELCEVRRRRRRARRRPRLRAGLLLRLRERRPGARHRAHARGRSTSSTTRRRSRRTVARSGSTPRRRALTRGAGMAARDRDEPGDPGARRRALGASSASPCVDSALRRGTVQNGPGRGAGPRDADGSVVDSRVRRTVESRGREQRVSDEPDDTQQAPTPSLWPIGFAIGVAVHPRRPRGQLAGADRSARARRSSSASSGSATCAHARAGRLVGRRTRSSTSSRRRPRRRRGGARSRPTAARGFLALATIGVGGVIGAGVTLPVARLRACCRRSRARASRRPTSTSGRSRTSPRAQFVITTFLENPSQGEVSRRTAYIRNNGLTADKRSRASRSSTAAASTSAAPCSRTAPEFEDKDVKYEGRRGAPTPVAAGRASAARATAARTTPRATASPARPSARSTASRSRS